eukprot:SAG11_NODE_7536_length_1133_cov_1.427466_1_plen_227_part_00
MLVIGAKLACIVLTLCMGRSCANEPQACSGVSLHVSHRCCFHRCKMQVLAALNGHARSSCPMSEFDECEVQSLRKVSGGINAMCSDQCADVFDASEASPCLGHQEYPANDDVYARTDTDGDGFSDNDGELTLMRNDVWHNNPRLISDNCNPNHGVCDAEDRFRFSYTGVACCQVGPEEANPMPAVCFLFPLSACLLLAEYVPSFLTNPLPCATYGIRRTAIMTTRR